MPTAHFVPFRGAAIAVLLAAVCLGHPAIADDPSPINVILKDHRFAPAEIHVPTGKRTVLIVRNEDATPEEFDSSALQIEKVITDSLISFGANADDINRDAELTALDIDSLDLAELSQIIEEQFGVELSSADVAEIHTVGDAIDLVSERA